MIRIRPSAERGHFDFGWLNTRHTFAFGDYRDPEHTQFRALRVLNEDRIAPSQGFGTHPHQDMEILTWVLEGALEHKDSQGGGGTIRPGELQRMSAGTGILHSEFNASATDPVHLLQIWILPEAQNLAPRYGQTAFPQEGRRNRFQLLASRSGREGSLDIHQDAELHVADLEAGKALEYLLAPARSAWIQVARGGITLNGLSLGAGDGAAISQETSLDIAAAEASQLLLFDLA